MKNPKKGIGILGGTFDPIHLGHLIVSEFVREELQLEKILFIPARVHPLKNNQQITESRHRYRMTELATQDNPYFEVSDVEIRSERISYTIDTIRSLQSKYDSSRYQLHFFMGMDNLNQLHKWKEPEQLLSICTVVAFKRPDFTPEPQARKYLSRVQILETPQIEISSTEIRQRVKEGKSIRYFVADPVREYILSQRLYGA